VGFESLTYVLAYSIIARGEGIVYMERQKDTLDEKRTVDSKVLDCYC